jgi:hypothetical protein
MARTGPGVGRKGTTMTSRRTLLRASAGALSLTALGTGAARAGTRAPWDRLHRSLRGRLVLPGDQSYATAKQLDLQQFDAVNPEAIAYCSGARDVAACLAFAQDCRLPIAVRSGGHSYGGYSTTEGLVIDVSGLDAVAAEQDGQVRVGTGAQAVDIVNALTPAGLAVSVGARATVAAGGFIQGGGIGYFSRSLGLACDAMTSARVVLANGRHVTASRAEHPDLYWALRGGGGGNFDIVTSYVIRPTPLAVLNSAFLSWNYDAAVDFLDGYTHWLVDAPRTVGAAAIVVLGDSAPGNTPFVGGFLVSTGSSAELQAEVARLVAMTGPPASQSLGGTTYRDFVMGNFGCSALTVPQCHRAGSSPGGTLPRDGYGLVRGRMIASPPPRSGWDQVVGVFDAVRTPGEVHKMELLAVGGAVGDLSRTDTAYVHRDSLMDVNFLSSGYRSPAPQPAGRRWVDAGFAAVDPYSNAETYLNFTDPTLPGWRDAYYGENYARLAAIKQRYDPFGVFRFAQSIGS